MSVGISSALISSTLLSRCTPRRSKSNLQNSGSNSWGGWSAPQPAIRFVAGTAGYSRLFAGITRPTLAPAGVPTVQRAGWRAAGHARAARYARRRRARSRRAQRPPERWAAPPGNPRPCATTTGRSQDARPGRHKREAAAAVAPLAAGANGACGRADRTVPRRRSAGQSDRAPAAWDWGCRVAGREGCRSFPWRNDRAPRAREAKRDQDQGVDIPRFRVWEAAKNWTAKADRQ